MNFIKYLLLLLIGMSFLNSACTDEDDLCLGIVAPAGYLCDNGKIIEDPDGFCLRATCPAGFRCDEASKSCIADDKCAAVTCPEGFSCQNGSCIQNAAGVVVVSGFINENTKWTSDKTYELANKVVVPAGVTLTIEAGTIIKGRQGTGSLATALIIARGAKLMAEGTAAKPIIFTSSLDNIKSGQFTGTNLTEFDNEKWGGVIILGKAPISAENGDTEALIEGVPADDGFGFYGGSDVNDNSGILRYLSIRHGGAEIGEGNEINGLTLGGVGAGTIIENIEVSANLDDGIELFGGTVNIKNALVALVGDDGIDIDQNYAGTIDNFIIIQADGVGTDEGLEIDGPENSTYANGLFTLKNGSIISLDGVGSTADLKSKAQGTITNVAWINYKKFLQIRTSYGDNCTTLKTDAYSNLKNGKLIIENNQFVTTAQDLAEIYTGSVDNTSKLCGISVADQAFLDDYVNSKNKKVTTASVGADKTVFAWSWSVKNHKL